VTNFFSFFPDSGCPLDGLVATPPKIRSPGVPLEPLRDPPFKLQASSFKTRLHAYHLSRTRAPSDISRLQCRIRPDRVRRLCGSNVVSFAELCVELQSFLIRTRPGRPEFPALVVTGSCAPLHTSRTGPSGYPAFLLAMGFFTLTIVVGASVSDSDL
jgi:hypothetical protein